MSLFQRLFLKVLEGCNTTYLRYPHQKNFRSGVSIHIYMYTVYSTNISFKYHYAQITSVSYSLKCTNSYCFGKQKKGKRRKPPDVKHHQPTVAPSSIIPRPLPPPSRFFPMAVDQPEFMRQNGEPRGHTQDM